MQSSVKNSGLLLDSASLSVLNYPHISSPKVDNTKRLIRTKCIYNYESLQRRVDFFVPIFSILFAISSAIDALPSKVLLLRPGFPSVFCILVIFGEE